MISHLCFNGYWPSEINPVYARYLFSDEALSYSFLDYFLTTKQFNRSSLENEVEVVFHNCPFPFRKETTNGRIDCFRLVFDEKQPHGLLVPRREALDNYEKTQRSVGFFDRTLKLTDDQREAERKSLLDSSHPDICHAMGTFLAERVLAKELPQKAVKNILFAFFYEFEDQNLLIEKTILKLGGLSEEAVLKAVFDTEIGKNLIDHGITTLEELTLCSANKIQALFPFGAIEFCKTLSASFPIKLESIAKKCSELIGELMPKEELTVRYRSGLTNKTLDEIGNDLGVTRERIRQIEAKAIRKLAHPNRANIYNEYVLAPFNRWFLENRDAYGLVPLSTIEKELGDEKFLDSLITILTLADKRVRFVSFKYDYDIGVLHEIGIDLKEVYRTLAESLPDTFGEKAFEDLPEYIKKGFLLYKTYKLNDLGKYVRAGKNKRSDYLDVIEETFPDGYRLYSKQDYDKFAASWKEKNGDDCGVPSPAAVRGAISSYWQLYDDGLYQPKHKCPTIPDYVLPLIYDFIEMHLPAVYYKSIFFQNEAFFLDLGIENPAMLKGAFDPLDNKYKHERDYLKSKSWTGTCYDAIARVARSIEGIFDYNKLRESFPYVDNYVFAFCLDKQEDIIHLFNEYYLHVDATTFSNDDLADLEVFIDRCLISSGVDSISCSKLYEKLKFVDETNLLQRLQYAFNENALLAIIDKCLGCFYDTTFNYVGRKGKTAENRWAALTQYIQSKDEFRKDDLDAAAQKYGMSVNITFMDLVKGFAATHVQVGKDLLIKKELLQIDDAFVSAFASAISMLVKTFGELNTKTFNRYFLLPNVPGRTWTKHMLAGIARSYLNDEYEVATTDSDYRTTDFIIRRKKDE